MLTTQQNELRRIAELAWAQQGRGKRNSNPYSEEAITLEVANQLVERFPQATVATFNRHEESRNGADWMWAFHDVVSGIGTAILVQAKILNARESHYDALWHLSGKAKHPQNELLTQAARRMRLAPFYAFYNHLTDQSRVPKSCKTIHQPEAFGISLASAANVVGVSPDKSFDAHSAHSTFLHCILCTRQLKADGTFATEGNNPAIAIHENLKRLSTVYSELNPGPIPERPLPPVAKLMLDGRPGAYVDLDDGETSTPQRGIWSEVAREFRGQPNLRGVVLFRLD